MSNSKKENFIDFAIKEQKTKEYNNEIVNKTLHYQKKFGFETSPRQGHEFWNNEADAFKHTFMGADLSLKYGSQGSLWAGMYHEYQTPNNPPREWNMDSWNNHQGIEIAKEIENRKVDIMVGKLSPGIMITDFVVNAFRDKKIELSKKNKQVYNILGDYPDVVANFLVNRMISNTDNNVRINWLTNRKAAFRFMSSFIRKRDFFSEKK